MELDFFDNPRFVPLFEPNNIIGGIGELDFFDIPRVVPLFKPYNISGGIGELDFFGKTSVVPSNRHGINIGREIP